jgi:hypothetical protein
MRNVYGTAKVAAFVALGALLALSTDGAPTLTPELDAVLRASAHVCVLLTVAINLIRGVPVIWDGRAYLLRKS